MSQRKRLLLFLGLPVCLVAAGLTVYFWPRSAEPPPGPAQTRIVLPGVQADGSILLPSTWSIRPAGTQVELGDYPVNLALHPEKKWLAVLHAGNSEHEIQIVQLDPDVPRWLPPILEGLDEDIRDYPKQARVRSRVVLPQTFYGLAFSPDGKSLYASGGEFEVVHAFDFKDGELSGGREIAVADDKLLPEKKFIPAGLIADEKTLYTAGVFGHAVSILPLARPANPVLVQLEKDSYPYTCLVDGKRERLFVSLWGGAAVVVIDLKTNKVDQKLKTQQHPTEMAFGPGEKTLFVACSNSTRVSVLDLEAGKEIETINAAFHPNAPSGNTPCSLNLTPDGKMLFVANADANNVAVFNVAEPRNAKPLGFIPAGIYPTSVRYNSADNRIYVANGRGTTPKANPQGPNPNLPKNATVRQYIGSLYRGTLGVINLPDATQMARYTKEAHACSPLRSDLGVVGPVPEGNPIPGKIGGASPIKYCIYIIRENRTYDHVLGDMKEGNGDPSLCIFPEKVTPNAHRLARQFVLLDNFYCDGEVSADGHEWSMGAYCTDFVKKVWPLNYRGSPTTKLDKYPAEGNFDVVARPAGGYLWDRCAAAGVSYRSYGEWVENGKTPALPAAARVPALVGFIDPWFRGFDLDYPDAMRANRFISELRRFEKEGGMPRLSIVRLPNDHTHAAKPGKPTPTAMVAENDLALGRVIEAITESKFWKETAIFIVEDDAQNGSDHVDAHRSIALVISPYTQHGRVDSTMYSTSSVLRTMELILGLEPMSQFDAAARPMYNAFQAKPNLGTYKHLVPEVDMKAVNTAHAWGAKESEGFDFSREDAVDDLLLNEIIWRSVRGPNSPMPPPVHAAFIFPHLPK
jgi:WD40 repeat protein